MHLGSIKKFINHKGHEGTRSAIDSSCKWDTATLQTAFSSARAADYNQFVFARGCIMAQSVIGRGIGCWILLAALAGAQSGSQAPKDSANVPPSSDSAATSSVPMTRQTRLELIQVFTTQVVYAHVPFPMGTLGLKLKNGEMTPTRDELQQAMAIYGPSVKQGDPAQITLVQFKKNSVRFELNGGPVRRKKWYEHIEVSGSNSTIAPGGADANAHGSFVELDFDGFVPEVSAAQLRALLEPVLDFNAKSKEQAYLDTMSPKVKQAIQEHRVLVGMDTDMVLHAKGKPPKKVREVEGDVSYEEWIYGDAPADVDFVRIVGDEVVQVKTMRMGGEKIVRTEREVDMAEKPKEASAEPDVKPAGAPSLMRPGEEAPEAVPGTARDPRTQPRPLPPDSAPPPGGDSPNLVARAR